MLSTNNNKMPDLRGLSMLLVDKSTVNLTNLRNTLKEYGAKVFTTTNITEAIDILKENNIHCVLADILVINEDFIKETEEYKSRHPDSLFYLAIEHDSSKTSVDFTTLGIDDCLEKPIDPQQLGRLVEMGFGRTRMDITALTVADPLVTKLRPYFKFRSPAMRRALINLPRIAASDQAVLVMGETGTGKEIISRAIHVLSPRVSGPFMAINCSAIPESLIEGELFGHEKGAFTGALKTRKGKFESTNNGTILLDEIGDMPMNLQVRLLRVLEESQVYRVGSEQPTPINVRVIASTHRNLKMSVEEGIFREDLYFRINVLNINIPPLRERVEDISHIALYFLERVFAEMGMSPPYPTLSHSTINLLEQHSWKGNVRELRNVMTRIATLMPHNSHQVLPIHVLPHLDGREEYQTIKHNYEQAGVFIPTGTPLNKVEDMIIEDALRHKGGNRTKAARMLGISIRTLRRKLNKMQENRAQSKRPSAKTHFGKTDDRK